MRKKVVDGLSDLECTLMLETSRAVEPDSYIWNNTAGIVANNVDFTVRAEVRDNIKDST